MSNLWYFGVNIPGLFMRGWTDVRIAVRDLPSAEAGLVPLLAAHRVPVVRIEPASADLEHVFLELTR